MADETINESNEPQLVPVSRVTELSGKVKGLSEAVEIEKKAREESDGRFAEAKREVDFYKGFAEVISTNPQAKDHQDEILAKVKGGYTVEDATFAVLGKAGKLGQPAPANTGHISGGSAPVTLPQNGQTKSISEMSHEEKRNGLVEAEKKGELSLS